VDIIECEIKYDYVSVILAMKTGYDDLIILQSVKSDKEILDREWKAINWKSIG